MYVRLTDTMSNALVSDMLSLSLSLNAQMMQVDAEADGELQVETVGRDCFLPSLFFFHFFNNIRRLL